jgi:DNA-binding LacI/PurR family transcriptional regulator
MGRRAFELLRAKIASTSSSKAAKAVTRLQAELRIRGSTGKIKPPKAP